MHLPTFLVAAAVGVSCHPSGHVHRSFHAKKEMVTAVINGKTVSWSKDDEKSSPFKQDKKPEAVVPTPAVAAVAPAPTKEADKSTGNSGSTGKGVTAYEPFCGGNSKRDYSQTTKENIAYEGNTGRCGYGTNFKLVASEAAMKGYKYGIKVSGGSKKLVCGAYNKIAENKEISGFWVENHAVKFDVAPGSEQWIAVDSNTQGGVMCTDQDKIPVRPADGYPLVTWAEIDFDSKPNTGHSGWDASGIPPSKGGQPCNALKFCAIKIPSIGLGDQDPCSNVAAGMACQATNAYGPLDEWKGGLGNKLPPFNDGALWLHADYS